MGFLSAFRPNPEKKAAKAAALQEQIQYAEARRWPDTTTRDIAMRYQMTLGLTHIRTESPKKYLQYLQYGYFEPITVGDANSYASPLTMPARFNSNFADAAEERLYWVLNHSRHPGVKNLSRMRPDDFSEEAMARARMRRAVAVDPRYASQYDTFRRDYGRKGYSKQVPHAPLTHEVVELGRTHPGGEGIDTMMMIDVSGSMGFIHANAGFEQPRHIDFVHGVLARAIHHITPRDHYHGAKEHGGIETVLFSNYGRNIGKIGEHNFASKWREIERAVGGGTQVMSGWQKVKQLHFQKHGSAAGATYHPVYGWQAPPDMVKLSLLVLLDGEAGDMDEWELDILGETWAYVTILLIGRDGCPDHHRHANELERVARANPRVTFMDVQGRVSERYLLHEVLQSLYPAQPPSDEEILNPKWDVACPAYTP